MWQQHMTLHSSEMNPRILKVFAFDVCFTTILLPHFIPHDPDRAGLVHTSNV